jgi:hypothetical protein
MSLSLWLAIHTHARHGRAWAHNNTPLAGELRVPRFVQLLLLVKAHVNRRQPIYRIAGALDLLLKPCRLTRNSKSCR